MTSIPLAARLRPATLAEFAGQAHLVGPGMVLRRLVEQKTLHSLVLWGPPGCGKTTLIRLLASETGIPLVEFSAVTSGIAEVRTVIAEAKKRLVADGSRTAVFIDELHRFNKAQQDAFLPHVEQGTIILLGATTENPYFSINAALRSRLKIYQLQGLTDADLSGILDRALMILATPDMPSPASLQTKVKRGESEKRGTAEGLGLVQHLDSGLSIEDSSLASSIPQNQSSEDLSVSGPPSRPWSGGGLGGRARRVLCRP